MIYITYGKLKPEEQTLINMYSIIGTYASIFGLAITLIQVVAVKEIAKITSQTINETKNRIQIGISIADVSEAAKLIQEVDSYLGTNRFEIARIRITDLRDKLIQFKSNESFKKIVKLEEIDEIISFLNLHLANLYEQIYSEENITYNSKELSSELQKIGTYLQDFKNNIQFSTI